MNLLPRLAVLFALGGVALGCGAADDDAEASSDAFSSSLACTFDEENGRESSHALTTGTGANAELSVVAPNTTCGALGGVALRYADGAGFFGAVPQLFVPIGVYVHDENGKQRSFWTTLILDRNANGAQLDGQVCGLLRAGEVVDMTEIAITDGMKWDSNDSKNYVVRFASQRYTTRFNSGVGAEVDVDLAADWPAGANCASPGLGIYYRDRNHYFGNAAELHGVALLHHHAGTAKGVTKIDLSLTAGNGRYAALSCGTFPAGTVIDEIELAFSDASGSRWDSNLSRNYRARCSF